MLLIDACNREAGSFLILDLLLLCRADFGRKAAELTVRIRDKTYKVLVFCIVAGRDIRKQLADVVTGGECRHIAADFKGKTAGQRAVFVFVEDICHCVHDVRMAVDGSPQNVPSSAGEVGAHADQIIAPGGNFSSGLDEVALRFFFRGDRPHRLAVQRDVIHRVAGKLDRPERRHQENRDDHGDHRGQQKPQMNFSAVYGIRFHCLLSAGFVTALRLLYGKAEFSELFAEGIILTVRIRDEVCPVEVKPALFIKILFVDIRGENTGNEDIVCPERKNLLNSALKTHGALPDPRRLHKTGWAPGKTELGKFIGIPSALYTAVVDRAHECAVGKVQDKFTGFLNNAVRIPLRPDGYRDHNRIGTEIPGPCGRHDVCLPVLIHRRDEHSRNRIQHISRFPVLSSHEDLPPAACNRA